MKIEKLIAIAAVILSGVGVLQAKNNSGLCPASSITGKTVNDTQGNNLGHVSKLLVDSNTGRIRYAVVEVDKTWNWNDPQVAVPFTALEIKKKGDGSESTITLDATKEKLEKAPKFKDGDADRLYSKNDSAPVYSYWAVAWYDDAAENNATKSSTSTKNPEKK